MYSNRMQLLKQMEPVITIPGWCRPEMVILETT